MNYLEKLIEEHVTSNNWDYKGLVQEVIERIDDIEKLDEDNYYDKLYESIDSTIIYYREQWIILEENCTPVEANWDEAINTFISECDEVLFYYIRYLKQKKEYLK